MKMIIIVASFLTLVLIRGFPLRNKSFLSSSPVIPSVVNSFSFNAINEEEHISPIKELKGQQPACYVILSNIQSGSNIGSICRNCLAFNVSAVVVIGRKDFRQKMRMADRGAKTRLKFLHFLTYEEAIADLKDNSPGGCHFIGVEITESSSPISNTYFDSLFKSTSNLSTPSNVAFLFGNEGGGLSIKQRVVCEHLVHIPQFSTGGMASINVACASAIVLYTFATWARYKEGTIQGEKFV
mmetsp:Transcript_24297/g.34826  ORF Transcript_24297/g.34826 Transcript_24297/m.34826 type:complete len:240 (-) Transcript_24297:234-953(-)